jgi:hypothetical protein
VDSLSNVRRHGPSTSLLTILHEILLTPRRQARQEIFASFAPLREIDLYLLSWKFRCS